MFRENCIDVTIGISVACGIVFGVWLMIGY